MTTTLTICKMCLDVMDPLDPGIYIIINDDTYHALVIDNDGDIVHDCTYSKSLTPIEDIIDELFENYNSI